MTNHWDDASGSTPALPADTLIAIGESACNAWHTDNQHGMGSLVQGRLMSAPQIGALNGTMLVLEAAIALCPQDAPSHWNG